MYGILELVLVVVVVLTPLTFRLIDEVYRGIYPSLEGSPQAARARAPGPRGPRARAGDGPHGRDPSDAHPLPDRRRHLSRAFGRLYAANTIGAIVGTLAAGLVLIELLGLSGALRVGAACSAIAGRRRLWLARGEAEATSSAAPAPAADRRP